MTGIEPSYIRPVLSTRRRLQNRKAQRRYREKAAQKKSCHESPYAVDWTSLSLCNFDPNANIHHGDGGVVIESDEDQAQPADTPDPSVSLISPYFQSPVNETQFIEDISVLDFDLLSRHRHGGNDTTALVKEQYPTAIHQQMRPACSSPPMELCRSPLNLDHLPPASPESILPIARTPQPVEPLLHVAVRSRGLNMISMLLKRGAAAVGDQDGNGTTALHIAAELGDEAAVSLLLSYGADVSIRNAQGYDALHLAVSAGQTAIVELMLDTCKINCRDPYFNPID